MMTGGQTDGAAQTFHPFHASEPLDQALCPKESWASARQGPLVGHPGGKGVHFLTGLSPGGLGCSLQTGAVSPD